MQDAGSREDRGNNVLCRTRYGAPKIIHVRLVILNRVNFIELSVASSPRFQDARCRSRGIYSDSDDGMGTAKPWLLILLCCKAHPPCPLCPTNACLSTKPLSPPSVSRIHLHPANLPIHQNLLPAILHLVSALLSPTKTPTDPSTVSRPTVLSYHHRLQAGSGRNKIGELALFATMKESVYYSGDHSSGCEIPDPPAAF